MLSQALIVAAIFGAIALVAFLIIQNKKDRKDLERTLGQDEGRINKPADAANDPDEEI